MKLRNDPVISRVALPAPPPRATLGCGRTRVSVGVGARVLLFVWLFADTCPLGSDSAHYPPVVYLRFHS